MPPLVSCAGPGQGQPCPTGRLIPPRRTAHKAHCCQDCERARERAKAQGRNGAANTSHAYAAWIRLKKAQWIAVYGYVCAGGHPSHTAPHPCNPGDLTMHHPYSVAAGGPATGQVVGMCRRGNSELGATLPATTRGQGHPSRPRP